MPGDKRRRKGINPKIMGELTAGMKWNGRVRRTALVLMAGCLAAGLSLSCNSDITGPEFEQKKTGALYTYIGDTPVSDILTFRATITGMELRDATDPESAVTIISPGSQFIKIDLASYRDSSTFMNVASAPVAPYDQVKLRLLNLQIVVYDPTNDPPVRSITAAMTSGDAIAPLPAGYSIVAGSVNALRLDLDMLRSIEVDEAGQITGKVTPVLTAAPLTPAAGEDYGSFDDLLGFVRTVSPNPVGSFVGTFTMQLLSGSGPAIVINLTDQTDMHGVTDLRVLETGRVVEVSAYVDENGSVIARNVEVEDRAIVEEQRIAFIGNVFPTPTKDAEGNVTQFKLYVRREEPEVATDVPLDSIVTVNVQPSTRFLVSSRPANFANVPFDPSSIAIGQELIVHGEYTVNENEPTVVDASSIYLKLQAMQGGLSSRVQVGSDGRTGAFWLETSSLLLESSPIIVLTNNETVFINVFGLSEISPQAPLLIRGLPFYQLNDGTINGISIPAGSVVFVATQVHQLQ